MSFLFFKAIGGDRFPVKSHPVQALTGPEQNFAWNKPDILSTAVLLTLIAALWLATRPYPGIVHDARFYMVQALRELDPVGSPMTFTSVSDRRTSLPYSQNCIHRLSRYSESGRRGSSLRSWGNCSGFLAYYILPAA